MSVSEGVSVIDLAFTISDSSIAEHRIVEGDDTDTTNTKRVAKAATANTAQVLGVTLDSTDAADEVIPIRMLGVANVEVDGSGTAIDIGDSIVATTGGKGVKNAAVDATQQKPVGIALAPSSADGDVIPVLIIPSAASLVKGTA